MPVIVFEGPPGAGKTEVIRELNDCFARDYDCRVLNVESFSPVVSVLIEMAKEQPPGPGMTTRNSLFWIARVHFDAWLARLSETLNERDLVLVDRLWGSLMAYADFTQIGGSSRAEINHFWSDYHDCFQTRPEMTIYLDIPAEVALIRKRHLDPVEAEKVCQRFGELARKHDWQVVDATQSMEEIVARCVELIEEEFGDVRSR